MLEGVRRGARRRRARARSRAVPRARPARAPRSPACRRRAPGRASRAVGRSARARSTTSSRCSVSTSCTAAIARIRLTESPSAFCGSTFVGASLQPQERGDRLQVVLDAMVDLLGEHAAERHATVLERDGGLARDRLEQLAVVVGERRVAIDDELADRAAPPAQRQPHRVGARPGPPATRSARPRARPRRRSRGSTRRSSARSPRATPPGRATPRPPPRCARAPRARPRAAAPARRASRARSTVPTCEAIDVEQRRPRASVNDARLARADVERALEHVAGEDRHGEDRLVLVLAAGSGTP